MTASRRSAFVFICFTICLVVTCARADEFGDVAYIGTGRHVCRAFRNIESLKGEPNMEAGFVRYIEISSIPTPITESIVSTLRSNYKPGVHAEGPLTPVARVLILFDKARKPTYLLGCFDNSRVTVTGVNQVDSNGIQGDRESTPGCTISDAALAAELKAVFDKHFVPAIDMEAWEAAGAKK